MHEITPAQVTSKIRALFDPAMPTSVRCRAVLEGGNAGHIYIDDLDHPTMGFVWERDDGMLYRGGQFDQKILAQMVDMLRQEAPVALSFRDGDPLVDIFPPGPDAGAECIELERAPGSSDLTPFLVLPEGFTAHRMGRFLIENSPRLDETLYRYGDLENYLRTGMDVCILHGDEYVAEAGCDMDVGGVREAGVVVEPAYRHAWGFGTRVTAHLLKWCDELGVATYWDCVKLNIGSLKIARKLGFGKERSYKLYAWFPPVKEIIW